ncbi:MAG: TadE/TadG family type IV pilus assembly protein [Pseudomonadota bacterium]
MTYKSSSQKIDSLLKRFKRKQDGHAALEFSFIAPIMIFGILFSSIELTDGIMAHKHVDRSASTLADLVSRTRRESGTVRLQKAELEDIFIASDKIIQNYGIDGALMRVTSIERNESDDGYTVVWSKELTQGSTSMSNASQAGYIPGGAFTGLSSNMIIPDADGLVEPGDHLVVAEVSYPFKPSFSEFIISDFDMKANEIRLPREGRVIHFCESDDDCTDDDDD